VVAAPADTRKAPADAPAPAEKGKGKAEVAAPAEKGKGKAEVAAPAEKGKGKGKADAPAPAEKGKGKAEVAAPPADFGHHDHVDGDEPPAGLSKMQQLARPDEGDAVILHFPLLLVLSLGVPFVENRRNLQNDGHAHVQAWRKKQREGGAAVHASVGEATGPSPSATPDKGKGKAAPAAPADKGKGKPAAPAPVDKGKGKPDAPAEKGKGKVAAPAASPAGYEPPAGLSKMQQLAWRKKQRESGAFVPS
jgi:hypothetical protein